MILRMIGLATLAGLAPLMALPHAANASITFSDGIFSDWTSQIVYVLNDSSGSSAQELSGGNPGAYLEVTLNTPGINRRIGLFHTSNSSPFLFNPSVSNSILSLDFAVDFFWINNNSVGAGQRFSLALEQGGNYYATAGETMFGNTSWEGFLESVTASDFGRIVNTTNGVRDFGQNPDFSSSGSAITFGLLTGNSVAGERIVGYDNYSLTISSVPECGSLIVWSLIGCTGILVTRNGRRVQRGRA